MSKSSAFKLEKTFLSCYSQDETVERLKKATIKQKGKSRKVFAVQVTQKGIRLSPEYQFTPNSISLSQITLQIEPQDEQFRVRVFVESGAIATIIQKMLWPVHIAAIFIAFPIIHFAYEGWLRNPLKEPEIPKLILLIAIPLAILLMGLFSQNIFKIHHEAHANDTIKQVKAILT